MKPVGTITAIFALASCASGAVLPRGDYPSCEASVLNPKNNAPPVANAGDAPYTIPERTLLSELFCTKELSKDSNPYPLVGGTGSSGAEVWQHGYQILLTNLNYTVCYVSPGPQLLEDSQDSSEYVAYAIATIYKETGKHFPIQGWSQGNLLIQWVLTFWPTTRCKVSQFVSLAGDFKGTVEAAILDIVQGVVVGLLGGAAPTVYQQTAGSNYLKALAAHGGLYNWVPTTSLYSITDEIVQPQGPGAVASSFLNSTDSTVGNIVTEDFCPHVVEGHAGHLYFNFDYQVILEALTNGKGYASTADVKRLLPAGRLNCLGGAAPGLTAGDTATEANVLTTSAAAVLLTPRRVTSEPPVRAYALNSPQTPSHPPAHGYYSGLFTPIFFGMSSP